MCDKRFCVPVLTALALAMFILVMRFLPELASWSSWDLCADEDCNVQSWLGALSGWAATVAAAVTVIFLRNQIVEQRKQTEFVLGDAPPTMDITPDLDDPSEMVVRLVNWNRRTLFVRAISLNVGNAMGIMEIKVDGTELGLGDMRWPYPLRGWEDRSNGPHTLQFKIAASEGNKIIREWPQHARVEMSIQLLDDRHSLKTLSALAHP
ncbi:hypothetical protein IB238_09180 [Rhizobium sp. ARZ01]|uniref:hypothetical protein n=1 Tax=Rhizobium sp. ARZ01 TaxID=2769313 RepID=UPI001782E9B1|nr:hypothetical protein [Rhizobium sp. ARZ01]MBD9372791.1 hypothetical protein [Rhizobium sp. ARZ01]